MAGNHRKPATRGIGRGHFLVYRRSRIYHFLVPVTNIFDRRESGGFRFGRVEFGESLGFEDPQAGIPFPGIRGKP